MRLQIILLIMHFRAPRFQCGILFILPPTVASPTFPSMRRRGEGRAGVMVLPHLLRTTQSIGGGSADSMASTRSDIMEEILVITAESAFPSTSVGNASLSVADIPSSHDRQARSTPKPTSRSTPNVSTTSSEGGTIRLVGRGGRGSRARLPSTDGFNLHPPSDPAQILTPQSGSLSRSESLRIVGRGGMGSRRRDLPLPLPIMRTAPTSAASPATPTPPSSPISPTSAMKMLYRPIGRGGAGSKSRIQIAQLEQSHYQSPDSTFHDGSGVGAAARSTSAARAWLSRNRKGKGKGKGKEKETHDASTYGMPTLTRTDTINTMASGFQSLKFLPVQRTGRAYQITATQDDILESVELQGSSSTEFVSHSTSNPPSPHLARLGKLLRTLGADGALVGGGGGGVATSKKSSRRSSVSSFFLPFQSISTSGSAVESPPPLDTHSDPSPLSPPQTDSHNSDSRSDTDRDPSITDTSTSDDHSDVASISSRSSSPLTFSNHLANDDSEDYDDEGSSWLCRSPTPTIAWAFGNHFGVESEVDEDTVSSTTCESVGDGEQEKNERDIEWTTGEWNCTDIREVIRSLRELRV
ncbi:hypothetical protein R3P38DRAFT_2939966 [Favolaschia claudopus]|uniref:Uncharacterized protein n=1 Tax=Favolaschia claudopus TaxID=2862362 RepID=A0AAW0BPA6_9AGAR